MQLALIGMFMTLFAYGTLVGPVEWERSHWPLTLVCVLGPKLVLAVLYLLAARRTARLLSTPRGLKTHRRLDVLTTIYSLALLPMFLLDLWVGWLEAVRSLVGGNLILIDELVVMLPTLGLMVWGWWCYYPIDRAMREAMILRHLDDGRVVYPIWSAGQFVLAQVRHQMLLVLLPLTLVLGWSEAVAWLGPEGRQWIGVSAVPWMIAAGAGVVFLVTPAMIRHVWDTRPLASGQLRQRLETMCAAYHVRVRELLLWRTFGGMANAAVLGLFPRLRYILLSDALLDQATAEEIEAVMAHELAHVRKRHMVWLLAAALGLAGLLELGVYAAVELLGQVGWMGQSPPSWAIGVLIVPAALAWYGGFGWVSRRVERQADAFAVSHMAQHAAFATRDEDGRAVIDREAVAVVVSALGRVAVLNHIRPTRKSWRHGSIAWRQAYLQSLVGQPAQGLGIDRMMRAVNLASLMLVGVLVWWSVA